jgi:hypothetical protein
LGHHGCPEHVEVGPPCTCDWSRWPPLDHGTGDPAERKIATKNEAPAAPTVEYTTSLISSSSNTAAASWLKPEATLVGDVDPPVVFRTMDDTEGRGTSLAFVASISAATSAPSSL